MLVRADDRIFEVEVERRDGFFRVVVDGAEHLVTPASSKPTSTRS